MIEQRIITADPEYIVFDEKIKATNEKALFLVCDHSIHFLKFDQYF